MHIPELVDTHVGVFMLAHVRNMGACVCSLEAHWFMHTHVCTSLLAGGSTCTDIPTCVYISHMCKHKQALIWGATYVFMCVQKWYKTHMDVYTLVSMCVCAQ